MNVTHPIPFFQKSLIEKLSFKCKELLCDKPNVVFKYHAFVKHKTEKCSAVFLPCVFKKCKLKFKKQQMNKHAFAFKCKECELMLADCVYEDVV